MKRKPIRIDWEELEDAFSNSEDDALSCLDTVTGHLALEGEGDDADDASFDAPMAAARTAITREDPTQIIVRPPTTQRKIEWMRSFLRQSEGKQDQEVLDALIEAIDTDDPARRLSEVLNAHSEVRDAWYLYRSDELHRMIDEWLAEHGLEITTPPPWKKE